MKKTRYNYIYLVDFLRKNKISQTDLAKILCISRMAVYNKLNNKSNFNYDEAITFKRNFNLTQEQVERFFFFK